MAAGERVAIFIDGWNFSKATYEGLGIRVDFRKLLRVLARERTLLRAYYYIGEVTPESQRLLMQLRGGAAAANPPAETAVPSTDHDASDEAVQNPADEQSDYSERRVSQQQGFLRMLSRNGYQVVRKPLKVFADGRMKADLDINLAIDMLTLAERCDRMILVSGDSDFVPVVDAVGKRGVRVEVVSSQQDLAYNSTPQNIRRFPARASDDLLDAADEFTELRDIVEAIQLHDAPRPLRPERTPA